MSHLPSFPLKERRGVALQFTGISSSGMSRNSRIWIELNWIVSTFHTVTVTLENFSSLPSIPHNIPSLDHTSPLRHTSFDHTSSVPTIQSLPHCTTKVDTITMKSQFLAILAALLSFGIATPLVEKQGANCRNLTISVPISAYNAPESQIPTSLSEETLTAFFSALGEIVFSQLVTGTYDTSLIYCEPQGYNETREKTLQFFVHGATYTKGCKYLVLFSKKVASS
jgi:hypothetical protein